MNPLLRGLMFSLEPETAHRLSILALKSGLPLARPCRQTPRLKTNVAGLEFANPLGIAAGYDKNAEVPHQLIELGFGFAEIGSITPLPQPGNPKPRIFRLPRDRAVINRLGFNNEGHEACLGRLGSSRDPSAVIGINVGANKDSEDKVRDYEIGIDVFAHLASYFTINISSPNTPGLRSLQAREQLSDLLARVKERRDMAGGKTGRQVPLFLKIAPDLTEQNLDDIAAEVQRHEFDGLVVSNTTVDRKNLADTSFAHESGGLSGRPLFEKSTKVLAQMRDRSGAGIAIIGVGGVDSAETAIEKIRAGADLVQLYSGFVYGGPSLPSKILHGMEKFAQQEGLDNIREIRDSGIKEWCGRKTA